MVANEKVGQDDVSQGLLTALRTDEADVQEKHNALRTAYAEYDVSSSRYAAMRDALRQRLGVSPYSKNVLWPTIFDDARGEFGRWAGYARHRFVEMKVGDAVVEVLQESDVPLALDEISIILTGGGLRFKDTRAVNAALMRTTGVKKSDDGTYTYEEEKPDLDELPWG